MSNKKIRIHSHNETPDRPTGVLIVELAHDGLEPMLIGINEYSRNGWECSINHKHGWIYEDELLSLIFK